MLNIFGKLALFRSTHPDWTIIYDMSTPYDDVYIFRDTLHVVENTGHIVTIFVLDAVVDLATTLVFGDDKKFLVESDGAVLLVELYLSNREFEDFDHYDATEIAIEWRGDDCIFSTSTNDLGCWTGGVRVQNGMRVFNVDDGKISPLSECPGLGFRVCLVVLSA
ncbi:hypothetical protein Fmac_027589 [Flemingia macrophylla]|uniref:KIB1-4 beta-propeller domain-containing protein n=1 Tax=Flemingia macrophylla TaxID=520843 RepID=A0ABD1LJS1_9FABA